MSRKSCPRATGIFHQYNVYEINHGTINQTIQSAKSCEKQGKQSNIIPITSIDDWWRLKCAIMLPAQNSLMKMFPKNYNTGNLALRLLKGPPLIDYTNE